jgi:hypothetical protein
MQTFHAKRQHSYYLRCLEKIIKSGRFEGITKKKEEKSNQALTLILLSKQNYSSFFFILNFAYLM